MARIPALLQFADVALLLMRVLVGLVFITSGWSHAKDPVEPRKEHRAESRASPAFSASPSSRAAPV